MGTGCEGSSRSRLLTRASTRTPDAARDRDAGGALGAGASESSATVPRGCTWAARPSRPPGATGLWLKDWPCLAARWMRVQRSGPSTAAAPEPEPPGAERASSKRRMIFVSSAGHARTHGGVLSVDWQAAAGWRWRGERALTSDASHGRAVLRPRGASGPNSNVIAAGGPLPPVRLCSSVRVRPDETHHQHLVMLDPLRISPCGLTRSDLREWPEEVGRKGGEGEKLMKKKLARPINPD
jgi:hypothetical protein